MRDQKRKTTTMTTQPPIASLFYRRLHEALFIVLLAAGCFLFLSLVTYHRADVSWSHQADNAQILNAGGRVGAWISDFLLYLCGYVTYFFPIILFQGVWALYRDRKTVNSIDDIDWARVASRTIGFLMAIIAATSLLHLFFYQFHRGLPYESGGIIGVAMGNFVLQWFNRVGATIIFIPVLLIGITLQTGTSWLEFTESMGAFILHYLRKTFVQFPNISFRMPAIKFNLFSQREKQNDSHLIESHIEPSLTADPLFTPMQKTMNVSLHLDNTPAQR